MAKASANKRKTEPTERLSEQMIEVLQWVYKNQQTRLSRDGSMSFDPQKHVPWRPSAFIGENPTPSKSNALSTTLKRLEERGLLVRYSITYKNNIITRLVWAQVAEGRMRTTHVGLTRDGSLYVESLNDEDFDLEEYEAEYEHGKAKKQAQGLRLALGLINERIEKGTNDAVERDAWTARAAVIRSLNQLKAKYGGEP